MFYIKRNLLSVVLLIAAAVMSGCDSYSEKKAAMVDGWERTTAIAKIPMAEELAANGKYDEAADILAKCLLSAPKSPAVHLAAGKVYFDPDPAGSPAGNILCHGRLCLHALGKTCDKQGKRGGERQNEWV